MAVEALAIINPKENKIIPWAAAIGIFYAYHRRIFTFKHIIGIAVGYYGYKHLGPDYF